MREVGEVSNQEILSTAGCDNDSHSLVHVCCIQALESTTRSTPVASSDTIQGAMYGRTRTNWPKNCATGFTLTADGLLVFQL